MFTNLAVAWMSPSLLIGLMPISWFCCVAARLRKDFLYMASCDVGKKHVVDVVVVFVVKPDTATVLFSSCCCCCAVQFCFRCSRSHAPEVTERKGRRSRRSSRRRLCVTALFSSSRCSMRFISVTAAISGDRAYRPHIVCNLVL